MAPTSIPKGAMAAAAVVAVAPMLRQVVHWHLAVAEVVVQADSWPWVQGGATVAMAATEPLLMRQGQQP